jgi:2-C-methyl-D-erythritol 2,4-cyclodiphosphate synthase
LENEPPSLGPQPLPHRVGFGYDVHRLVNGRPLVLGGIEVPYDQGLEGHSDADVLLHALIDALLGAAGLGDIGTHFPSFDPSLEGISSLDMLSRVVDIVKHAGWRVENVDATIVAQQPRLSPHTPAMKAAIAGRMGISQERVNVKSKTTDGLGFTGSGEGMAAYCVLLLSRGSGVRGQGSEEEVSSPESSRNPRPQIPDP